MGLIADAAAQQFAARLSTGSHALAYISRAYAASERQEGTGLAAASRCRRLQSRLSSIGRFPRCQSHHSGSASGMEGSSSQPASCRPWPRKRLQLEDEHDVAFDAEVRRASPRIRRLDKITVSHVAFHHVQATATSPPRPRLYTTHASYQLMSSWT